MCSEGFTFPVTGWFSASISDEYDSDYGEFEGDRGEFSDDEEGLNYTRTNYNDADNNDEYSVNSDISDDSDDDNDDSSDTDDELEVDSDSDNESNAASESEMSEINIELPQPDVTFGRRSTTPSRFSKEMSPDDLKKIVDDEKERRMCVVCQDRSKSVLILPCRHMCLCVDCGNHIARSRSRERRKCPLCRSKINTIMNVYV
jgi:RING finger protein 26